MRKFIGYAYTSEGDFFFPVGGMRRVEGTDMSPKLSVAYSEMEEDNLNISFSYVSGEDTVGFRLTVSYDKKSGNIFFTVSQLDSRIFYSIKFSSNFIKTSDIFIEFLAKNCKKILDKLSEKVSNKLLSMIDVNDIISSIKLNQSTFLLVNEFSSNISGI